MSTSIWVCEKHYQELCRAHSIGIPIYTHPNWMESQCEIKDCHTLGEHLIDVYYVEGKAQVKP